MQDILFTNFEPKQTKESSALSFEQKRVIDRRPHLSGAINLSEKLDKIYIYQMRPINK